MAKMNERQKRFCEYYAQDPNATEAARKAGYSGRTAGSIGAENLKKPEILSYIRKLQEQAAAPRIATLMETMAFLSDTMRNPSQKPADRIRAAELILKSGGAFVRVHEDDGGFTITAAPRDITNTWRDVIIYDPESPPEPPDDDGDGGTVIYLPKLDTLEDHEPDDGDDERETGG